ncbi:hypothetical protein ACLOJK_023909 [Asimina triloba]
MNPPLLKKVKTEEEEETLLKKVKVEEEEKEEEASTSVASEDEEALLALIHHLKKRIADYKAKASSGQAVLNRTFTGYLAHRIPCNNTYPSEKLSEAERRLHDSESQLAHLRSGHGTIGLSNAVDGGTQCSTTDSNPTNSVQNDQGQSKKQTQSRPQLLIPAVNPKIAQPPKLSETSMKAVLPAKSVDTAMKIPIDPVSRPKASLLAENEGKLKSDIPRKTFPDPQSFTARDKGTKRKFEQKEHRDLIPIIRSTSSPCMVRFQPGVQIPGRHKRKLRCLELNPVNDQLFATSAKQAFLSADYLLGPFSVSDDATISARSFIKVKLLSICSSYGLNAEQIVLLLVLMLQELSFVLLHSE